MSNTGDSQSKIAASDGNAATPSTPGNQSAAKIFSELHREMELSARATNESGQLVKRRPRHLRPALTKKRKAAEKEDRTEMAMEVEDDKKRLRGSKVAFEDVVLNSMPLSGVGCESPAVEKGEGDDEVDADEILRDVAELGIDIDLDEEYNEEDGDDNMDPDKEEGDSDGDDDSDDDDQDKECQNNANQAFLVPLIPPMDVEHQPEESTKTPLPEARSTRNQSGKKKRVMFRLRDFSSHRLSLRHGEALAAHIRGDSESAIQKLRDVAKAAPGAPQVYSSLGMVYESMLDELDKGMNSDKKGKNELSHQKRRIELAQKTYASLHVAAVLCKKDFVLWERSGDAAMKMVQIYDAMIQNSNDDVTEEDFLLYNSAKCQTERKQWLEHAFSAYSSADNLRPPGVDVPCKLARIHMELGHFIDALSILTDLRNRGVTSSTGLEGSYPCWLLYADLMMKIGFECKQWNEGTSTNQSYMEKRWLRKYSSTFDWKERRLQALCLALEAAAGSKSCAMLNKRMKDRTKQLFVNEKVEKDSEQDQNVDAQATEPATPSSDDKESESLERKEGAIPSDDSLPDARKSTYEEERSNLVKRNEIELQKFDWTSESMNLVEGSHIHRDRMSARASLVEKHRQSLRELVKRSYNDASQAPPTPSNTATVCGEIQTLPTENDRHLPIQASCSTVCEIATLLLTQCVQCGLYQDGLVVARSVLSYYRERVLRHEHKMEKQRRHDLKSQSTQGIVQPSFDHDNLTSDESDDEEVFISDDEDLKQPAYLKALQKGVLPVNIRVLYALCLVGAGGQDFLALSYLERVMMTDELELFQTGADIGFQHDVPWMLFQTQFSLPLNKTSLLALVADMVKSKARVSFWARRVFSLLKSHLKAIDVKYGLDQLMSSNDELLRTNVLKILFAGTKMLIESAELDLEALVESGKNDSEKLRRVVGDGISALNIVIRFQHVLWCPIIGTDCSLPPASLETLDILAGAMSLLSHALCAVQDESHQDIIKDTISKSRSIISLMTERQEILKAGTDDLVSESWTSFPLPCDWQSTLQKNISLMSFNLCVGCCVSSFSGWTHEEFNLDQLQSRDNINVFGLNLDGSCVAGFLSADVASSLSRQWEYIHQLLPKLDPLRFDMQLSQRMDTEWHQKIRNVIKRHSSKSNSIALFKEDYGLMTLLSFSMMCLVAAEHSERGEKDNLLKLALSVVLPVTQFGIDKNVWQSSIGTRAISEKNETSIGYFVDENSQWLGPTKNTKGTQNVSQSNSRQSQERPNRKASSRSQLTPRLRDRSKAGGAVHVPTSLLLGEWSKDDLPPIDPDPSESARLAMKTLDDSMKNLKKSRTINALERSSLDVSVALIEVASYNECHNPFLCLQQAAIFAAMGPKQGNNDEPFKKFLPLQKKCTALNALVILGRADCLRAIQFLDSAQFLCSWVANVCRMHRNNIEESLTWTSRWKVIGIVLSFVSSTINEAATYLGKKLSDWDEVAKQEIAQGKSDALILLNSRQMTDDETGTDALNTNEGYDALLSENRTGHVQLDHDEFGDIHDDSIDIDKPAGCDELDALQTDFMDNDYLQEAPNDDLLFAGMNWAPV
eukprot:CCRYP_015660-RB/>CCRYP_015660-RB protein AED:0.34 eAED:0.34 QI:350/1/1/1/0.8/0.66/6/1929/1583